MMRLVAGHRRGASSDFGGLYAGWESTDRLVRRAVSRKALWYETPSETAIFCHSFTVWKVLQRAGNLNLVMLCECGRPVLHRMADRLKTASQPATSCANGGECGTGSF